MATKKKKVKEIKDIDGRVSELKIELLKQTTKRRSVRKEIARLLTYKNQTKLEGKK